MTSNYICKLVIRYLCFWAEMFESFARYFDITEIIHIFALCSMIKKVMI